MGTRLYFPPEKYVLRTFIALRNPSPSAMFEHVNLDTVARYPLGHRGRQDVNKWRRLLAAIITITTAIILAVTCNRGPPLRHSINALSPRTMGVSEITAWSTRLTVVGDRAWSADIFAQTQNVMTEDCFHTQWVCEELTFILTKHFTQMLMLVFWLLKQCDL
jgi:hypothetical protein